MHAQVEGSAVNVGFEWGNDGSLHVDVTADAAANGAPPTENTSPVQYSKKTSAAPFQGILHVVNIFGCSLTCCPACCAHLFGSERRAGGRLHNSSAALDVIL